MARKKSGRRRKGPKGRGGSPSAVADADAEIDRLLSHCALDDLANGRLGTTRSGMDGTVVLTHGNISCVVSDDGDGEVIDVYRLLPMRCVCGLGESEVSERMIRQMRGGDGFDDDAKARAEELFLEAITAGVASCPALDPTSDEYEGVCHGHPCDVHRFSTDPLAEMLEARDWTAPGALDALSHPLTVRLLVLAAAGSLLNPIRCDECHGVVGLRRGVGAAGKLDESRTLPWIRYLLEVLAVHRASRAEARSGDVRESGGAWGYDDDDESTPLPDLCRDNRIAGGCTPLGAAVKSGHLRCAVELLRGGASVDEAFHDLVGSAAGGHVCCILECKADDPTAKKVRLDFNRTGSADILRVLAYAQDGFADISEEEEATWKAMMKGNPQVSENLKQLYGARLAGSFYDGDCVRFLYREEFSDGIGGSVTTTRVSCHGFKITREGETTRIRSIGMDPLEDPKVIGLLQKARKKAKPRFSCGCCCKWAQWLGAERICKQHRRGFPAEENSATTDGYDAGEQQPTPATSGTRATEAKFSLRCSTCNKERPRDDFSTNQKKKGNDRRCRECVDNGTTVPSSQVGGIKSFLPQTNHLNERKRERGISDEELQAAMRDGESRPSRDGTVRYTHKGIVYITTQAGVGITAFRLSPMQCICGLSVSEAKLEEDTWFDVLEGPPMSRKQRVMAKLEVDLLKAAHRGCASGVMCVGCKVHRSATDSIASFLERQSWTSRSMREVMSHPQIIRLLVLTAAGSLLNPVYCAKCRGVKGLKRSENPKDESDTVPWLCYLLDIAKRQRDCDKEKYTADISVPDSCLDMVFGDITPLCAAAIGGNFRCALELLKRGSSVELAMSGGFNGPCSQGHVACLLHVKEESPSNRHTRLSIGCVMYGDMLQLLAYSYKNGFRSISEKDEYTLEHLLKMYGLWDKMFLKSGCNIVGTFWDGYCIRILLKGSCDCDNAACIRGGVFVSSVGIRLPKGENGGSKGLGICPVENCDTPLEDSVVKSFLKEMKQKAEPRYKCGCCCQFAQHPEKPGASLCQQHRNGCCSHSSHSVSHV